MADPVLIIQATLAPIFMVNGAAIFLNFAQARLFRVIDRLRATATQLREAALPDEERQLILHERARMLRRTLLLRNAILFGVLVIALTVITTGLLLLVGLDPALNAGAWPIYSFGGALAAFFVALALVTSDAFLSVAAARGETVR